MKLKNNEIDTHEFLYLSFFNQKKNLGNIYMYQSLTE